MAAIEIKNLIYSYKNSGAKNPFSLKNISFTVKDGEYIAVIGHAGSGKSTLLKLLVGILKPDSGKIYINGVDVWKEKFGFKSLRKNIGFVFQNPTYQLFEETVRKDIEFGPRNFGFSEEEIGKIVKNVIDMVGVEESILDKSPFEISGGQKRRVALAGVMAYSPNLLFFDEPVSGLDPIGKEKILKIIKDYNKNFNATVVLITHRMEDLYYADRILVLNKGEIFIFGSVEEVFENVGELKKIGLDIPDISKVFLKLKDRGFNLDSKIYSVDLAVKEIKRLILKTQKKGADSVK